MVKIKIFFALLFLLLGTNSQASTFRPFMIRAYNRFKAVRADIMLSRSQKAQVAAGVSIFCFGLNSLEDIYRMRQDNQIRAGWARMQKGSELQSMIKVDEKKISIKKKVGGKK